METFDRLRFYNIRLNPQKCVFGITSSKFLGYLVTQCRIEANPKKIHIIIDMKSPFLVKEV